MTEKFLGPIENLKQVPSSLFRKDVISGSADDWHEVLILSRSGRPAARFFMDLFVRCSGFVKRQRGRTAYDHS